MRTPRVQEQLVLAVDFDGTIARDGEPVEGCEDALRRLRARYTMVVHTARHDLEVVHLWLITRGLRAYFTDITNRKPRAHAYLDDRGVRFTDWASALEELL